MRLTIGRKLNGLIVALQILSICGVVVLATRLFTTNLTELMRKSTLDSSAIMAGRVRAEMRHVADRARMLGAASFEDYKYDEDKLKFVQDNLAADPQWVGISLYTFETGEPAATPAIVNTAATQGKLGVAAAPAVAPVPALATAAAPVTAVAAVPHPVVAVPPHWAVTWRLFHPELAQKLALTKVDFDEIDKSFPLDLATVGKGNVDFAVSKLKDGTPSLRMGLPLVQQSEGVFSRILAIELHQERFTALFADATTATTYLVDRRGRVLASTDPAKIPFGEDLSKLAIIALLATTKADSGPQDFKDSHGQMQIGAYQRVGFAGLTVISQVPMATAELAQKQLVRRTGFLGGAFLFLALCLGFLFSQTITKPVKALAAAAGKVAQGDFTIRLPGSSSIGDEIQRFSGVFNEMVSGLAERDKVKTAFAKFHSKEMADKVLSGELKLGGERKAAAVFFSDVRGFTAMSEKLDPEALVMILNRYMTRMVAVIMRNGGIVDKYVGDAIMAVWGVPIAKEGDCVRAVRACIEMRQALGELNEEFKAEGLPLLKIGMGLNFGQLVSGNIGSEERMEFTVIGDTVNTASRIESLTKEFGTDLLISQEILDQLEGKYVVEKAHEAKVKGKSGPLIVYKVHGYIDEQGNPVHVETPYSVYAAEKSDKVVHDAPAAVIQDAPAADVVISPSALKLMKDLAQAKEEIADLRSLIAMYEEKTGT